MPEVRLKIGPKTYAVACGEGEEDKIARLGAMIAQSYDRLGSARAPLETHNLVFAALFMADELSELQSRLDTAEAEAREHEEALAGAKAEARRLAERAAAKKEEFAHELKTLRKAEARARDETIALKTELAELRDAQRHQHDLFGSEIDVTALAAIIEAFAERAETAATALETTRLEQTRDTA